MSILRPIAITFFIFIFTWLNSSTIKAQDLTSMTVSEHLSAMEYSQPQNLSKFSFESLDSLFSSIGVNITGAKNVTIGALPQTTNYMARLMFSPPVQTHEYVADVLQNIGLAQPAYAQGIGFSGLNPVLKVWKAFRNMAYFAYIVVFVVIGFMIMFRKKISSNAVMTIQEALPKLIITLILITFSYAIAGLVVDLMYLSIFVLVGLFQQAGVISDSTKTLNVLFGRNILGIAYTYFLGWRDVSGLAAEGIGNLVSQSFGDLAGVLSNGLVYAVIAVAVLIGAFRTLFQLITAYIGIVLSVVFAPIQLLANSFPGSDAFEKWIRGLIANAAIFPAVAAIIIIGIALAGVYDGPSLDAIGMPNPGNPGSGFEYGGFIPPFIAEGGGTNGSVGSIGQIIGIGLILLMPEFLKIIKESLKVKEQFGDMAMKNAQAGWKPVSSAVTAPYEMARKASVRRVELEEQAKAMGNSTYTPPSVRTQLGLTKGGNWWKKIIGWG